MKIVSPPEVLVQPYQCDRTDLVVTDMPTQYTLLFRESTGMDEVLGMAAQQPRDERPLRVISAGCSDGPEVDTVLALAYRYQLGPVEITGVDGNPNAIEAAQLARYRVQSGLAAALAEYTA